MNEGGNCDSNSAESMWVEIYFRIERSAQTHGNRVMFGDLLIRLNPDTEPNASVLKNHETLKGFCFPTSATSSYPPSTHFTAVLNYSPKVFVFSNSPDSSQSLSFSLNPDWTSPPPLPPPSL